METELLRRELAETESELQIYETTPRLLHSVAGNFACTISFLPFRPIPTETLGLRLDTDVPPSLMNAAFNCTIPGIEVV